MARLLRFILLAWKDAFLRVFSVKGRTSRGEFIVVVTPVIAAWLGIASWFTVTEIDRTSDLYNTLTNLRLASGIITFASLLTLMKRRINDGAKNYAEAPYGPMAIIFGFIIVLIHRLFFAFDDGDNLYGPPQKLSTHDPKRIG